MSVPVAILFPLKVDSAFEAEVAERHPSVELRWTPYLESSEIRAIKGSNNGKAPSHPPVEPTEEQRKAWSDAEIVIGMDLRDDAAELFPRLRWFQATTAGVDQFDTTSLRSRGIGLSTASGVGAVSIAEFVMARILQEYKSLRIVDAQQDRHEWRQRFGSELNGKTLGIIGFGAIGRQIAVRARAFGVRTIATRASARPGDTDPDVDELRPAADLDKVLAECDIVVAALPTSEATIDLFDAGRFAHMRPGAIFCNVGRGVHVVEPDLIDALEHQQLRAAILDVARAEPLPEADPLWDAPNLYLSPHSSVSLDRYEANVLAIALENIGRFLKGETLTNQVLAVGMDDATD